MYPAVLKRAPENSALTVGYVHVGPLTHGVTRYGRLLAFAAANRADLRVLEGELSFDEPARAGRQQIIDCAKRLGRADIIHLQYNAQHTGCVWGSGWHQLLRMQLFVRTAGVPFVVTVHDVYEPVQRWSKVGRHPIREARRTLHAGAPAVTLRWLRRRASRLFVSSREEGRRIPASAAEICVIPHFVEPRSTGRSREDAKAALGLGANRVVTLLGFIHERKGHRLLIEALPRLPEDVVVVFVGAPARTDGHIVQRLQSLAASTGVGGRVRITGYLPEDDLNLYLAATDVAVCPFRSLSASASLSTWISADRPIVASQLPQIAEYNLLEPDAISTFEPYTAGALADAIRGLLNRGTAEQGNRVGRLRDQLSLATMLDRHVDAYRHVVGSGFAGAPR